MKWNGIPLALGYGVQLRNESDTSFTVRVEFLLGEGAEDHHIAHIGGVSGLTSLSNRLHTCRAASTDLRNAQMRPGIGYMRWPCGPPQPTTRPPIRPLVNQDNTCCNKCVQASGTLRGATEVPGQRQSRFREIPVVCS